MRRPDDLMRENEALRDRLSRLSEASLRINESLDFDKVLLDELDSARAYLREEEPRRPDGHRLSSASYRGATGFVAVLVSASSLPASSVKLTLTLMVFPSSSASRK